MMALLYHQIRRLSSGGGSAACCARRLRRRSRLPTKSRTRFVTSGRPSAGRARSPLYGKAFENWVFHELCAHSAYSGAKADVAYWRLASGIEVDFILNDMEVAIDAKAGAKIFDDHLRGLRQLLVDHPEVRRRIVVCRESRARRTGDGIEILPIQSFVRALAAGDVF